MLVLYSIKDGKIFSSGRRLAIEDATIHNEIQLIKNKMDLNNLFF